LNDQNYNHSEHGFSLLEVLIAIVVMMVVTGAIFGLMKDSMKTSHATLEMSDAQESARTGHEYITRDLVNAGDGLNSITDIRVPKNFVTNYLSSNPIPETAPGFINLGLITADNNVVANTTVPGTAPVETIRASPFLTDRITILQMETRPEIFTPITLAAGALTPVDGVAAVSPADIDRFSVGEIYFITSAVGGIFATITKRQGVGTPTPSLVFGANDAYGLNSLGGGGQFDTITAGATLPISICRMKIIHYYINSAGLLMRRVFGVAKKGFNESVIAEHAVSLQFRYFLNLRDANDNVVQPVAQLRTSQEQVETRTVEVTLTVETPHALQNGKPQQVSMTTSTSVRNMQFRQSLQPTAGG
jgi:type II secretory pathway pseudopilin PulG